MMQKKMSTDQASQEVGETFDVWLASHQKLELVPNTDEPQLTVATLGTGTSAIKWFGRKVSCAQFYQSFCSSH